MRGDRVNVSEAITAASSSRKRFTGRRAIPRELAAVARWSPSRRLAKVALEQRRSLLYDALELNEYAAMVEQRYGLPGGLINALKNAGEVERF